MGKKFTKGISSLGDLIPDFMAKTGINRTRRQDDVAEKWLEIAADFRENTAYDGLRRGVLEILVSDALVIQELMFRKKEFLEKMREAYPKAKFQDIRFRVGRLREESES
ncbi:MAG: DUF721 domain-containing protein [Planctomycetia bacterium]|nr:DUF721 domain-containing protein [Planctomycetia bacterium]